MPKFYNINDGSIIECRYYKDAPALGGVCRVSEIAKIMPKPMLEKWKYQQILDSQASTIEEAIEYMENRGKVSADAGSDIHSICETMSLGQEPPWTPNLDEELRANVIRNYKTWYDDMLVCGWEDDISEEVLVNRKEGYGGRCDRQMHRVGTQQRLFVDFKSQDCKIKKNGDLSYNEYPEWIFQLAAYAAAKLQLSRNEQIPEDVSFLSVIIDRGTGCFINHYWDKEEIQPAWETFISFRDAYYHYHKIYHLVEKLLDTREKIVSV